MIREPDWKTQAACRTAPDPELFFPAPLSGRNADQIYAPARRVCAQCPVRNDCLLEAMAVEGDRNVQYRAGVWGGLSPGQRVDLNRTINPRGSIE